MLTKPSAQSAFILLETRLSIKFFRLEKFHEIVIQWLYYSLESNKGTSTSRGTICSAFEVQIFYRDLKGRRRTSTPFNSAEPGRQKQGRHISQIHQSRRRERKFWSLHRVPKLLCALYIIMAFILRHSRHGRRPV